MTSGGRSATEMVVHIPHDQLAPGTLAALVDDFITRDGAVHGHTDHSIEARRDAVLRQLRAGTAVIVFDEEDESVSIVTKESEQTRGDAETDDETLQCDADNDRRD
jgi:uncharacterized protein YheU (UPF0270 family)